MGKNYQTFLVLIIIGIVIIVCFKYIDKIIDKASLSSAKTQTRTLMVTMEQIYAIDSLNGEEALPITMVFKDGEMYLKKGAPAKSYYNDKVKMTGKLPKQGEIILTSEKKIIVDNIKIRNYICNTLKEEDITCKKA